MNAVTVVGLLPGIVVILIDLGKGALAVYLSKQLATRAIIPLLAGLFVVMGHAWMVFLGFQGGKGVGASVGALFMLSPYSILFIYLLAVPIALILTKDTYMAAVAGFFSLPFILLVLEGGVEWFMLGILLAAVVSLKHRREIVTYFQGRREIRPIVRRIFGRLIK